MTRHAMEALACQMPAGQCIRTSSSAAHCSQRHPAVQGRVADACLCADVFYCTHFAGEETCRLYLRSACDTVLVLIVFCVHVTACGFYFLALQVISLSPFVQSLH